MNSLYDKKKVGRGAPHVAATKNGDELVMTTTGGWNNYSLSSPPGLLNIFYTCAYPTRDAVYYPISWTMERSLSPYFLALVSPIPGTADSSSISVTPLLTISASERFVATQ